MYAAGTDAAIMGADTKEIFDMIKIPRIEAMAVLLALLLCLPDPAGAQENHRFQTRAKVWDMFWNYGTQGVSEDPDAWLSYYRQMGMQYPGVWTRQYSTEFQDYWGERNWGSLHPAYAALFESTATMPGFSTYIATRVGDDPEGEYYVSISKPRAITDDIRMMAYDASMGPEANIGYPNYSPLGPAMANWWPGESPVENRYVTEIHNYRYGHYMDPDKDNFPESLLIMRWTTKRGITVTKKVYTWSYPDYDDFQIMEYEFENTGDSDGDGAADLNGGGGLQLNDTFFAFSVRFFISQAGHGWMNYDAWYRRTRPTDNDDWFKFTEAANYDGPAAGTGMKMWYAFDGDNPLMPGDDIGKPYNPSTANPGYRGRPSQVRVPGELTAFQYAGFAPIAYLPSTSNDPGTLFLRHERRQQLRRSQDRGPAPYGKVVGVSEPWRLRRTGPGQSLLPGNLRHAGWRRIGHQGQPANRRGLARVDRVRSLRPGARRKGEVRLRSCGGRARGREYLGLGEAGQAGRDAYG